MYLKRALCPGSRLSANKEIWRRMVHMCKRNWAHSDNQHCTCCECIVLTWTSSMELWSRETVIAFASTCPKIAQLSQF
jgi:hypothetical protein